MEVCDRGGRILLLGGEGMCGRQAIIYGNEDKALIVEITRLKHAQCAQLVAKGPSAAMHHENHRRIVRIIRNVDISPYVAGIKAGRICIYYIPHHFSICWRGKRESRNQGKKNGTEETHEYLVS